MKYLSLFSGIGGFELGIQQAHESLCDVDGSEDGGEQEDSSYDERQRFLTKERKNACSSKRPACECSSDGIDERPLCIGYSEIDKYATAIYQRHFPDHTNYGDITKLDPATLPDFDFLCGGFPCQAFSIAGKRKGFDDTRGTLFFDIARILRAKRPRLFLLENVKGLLSHDNGKTFSTIIATLDELGYDLQWQVLNSKNHGVPQNRERVFIVGHLRGTSRPQVFPFGENKGTDNEPNKLRIRRKLLQRDELRTIQEKETATTGEPSGQSSRDIGYKPDDSDKRGGQTHADDFRIRRLTPTECERLQGFPDGWTEGVSDTQRYKTLGNAVTVNVIRDIVERLFDANQ